jgi:hypothetical protein
VGDINIEVWMVMWRESETPGALDRLADAVLLVERRELSHGFVGDQA